MFELFNWLVGRKAFLEAVNWGRIVLFPAGDVFPYELAPLSWLPFTLGYRFLYGHADRVWPMRWMDDISFVNHYSYTVFWLHDISSVDRRVLYGLRPRRNYIFSIDDGVCSQGVRLHRLTSSSLLDIFRWEYGVRKPSEQKPGFNVWSGKVML